MIALTSLESLFKEPQDTPAEALKHTIIADVKLRVFTGMPESAIDISDDPANPTDMIVKLIDPQAAAGYLVFQGESEYDDWLKAQLYEPSQAEIQEAGQRGSRP
jgi:hypothetical protein